MQSTMGSTIHKSVTKLLSKIWDNKQIDLRKLYPSLHKCTDQKSAAALACFDIGSNLLRARIPMPTHALPFLERTLSIMPKFYPAFVNIVITYIILDNIDSAKTILENISENIDNPEFKKICENLTDLMETAEYKSDINLLLKHVIIPDFNINEELFHLEREQDLVWSYSVNL